MPHQLSKSKYIRGLQCHRALWLDVYCPKMARYTAEQMRRFDRGREFEHSFKATFPNGIDISAELGRAVDNYPTLTHQMLGREVPTVLFEAGFAYNGVLVLADVVRKRADGSIDVFEVKSGYTLTETYRHDASVQHYVISHCYKVNSFNLVYQSSANEDNHFPFCIVELTPELEAMHDAVDQNIRLMKEVLAHGEPDISIGDHCTQPYACPYQHYCAQGVRQTSLF